MLTIDAKGKPCPMPVILAKKQLDSGAKELVMLVDNAAAVQNLRRLGENSGYFVTVSEADGSFHVALSLVENAQIAEALSVGSLGNEPPAPRRWALFVGNEGIGSGSAELGANLMAMLFYTLSQGENLPASILFMNGGVKLPTENEQVVAHLHVLQGRGCEILVCGACLSFYNITDRLQVGTVSNMYDISARMLEADKVLSF